MSIVLVGLNHNTAPVDIRERLAFPDGESLRRALRVLSTFESVKESLIFSTCNRVEVYVYSDEEVKTLVEKIKDFLSDFHKVPKDEFEKFLYVYFDRQAVFHLFKVTSSLDSMIVGEPQITGQVKDFYEIALSEKTTSIIFNHLVNRALFTTKRVRNETRIGENPVSVSYAAVGLIKRVFEDLSKKSVLLVGAGEMASLAMKHLISSGVKRIFVTNRTFQRAEELAREFNGVALPFEALKEHIKNVDIVLCSTNAPNYVVTEQMIREIMPQRKYKPIFFIDISVPRNIDPGCDKVDNVYLYNIDDLQDVVDSNILERKKEAEKALKIIEEETEKFLKWMDSLKSTPVIVSIRSKAEQIRQEEFEKFKNRFKQLPPEILNSIDYLTQSIINKIMHEPTIALRNNCKERELLIFAARKLFGVDSDEE